MTNEKTDMNNFFERFDLMLTKLENLEKEFSELKQSKVEVSVNKLMDIEEVSKYLSRTKNSIYKMAEKAKIPHTKKVGKLYFNKVDIDKWLNSGKRMTENEMAEQTMSKLINRRTRHNQLFS